MKEKQQKGMRQRAIEQFADVTTAFVAETFDLIDYPRSKSATRIKSDATNNGSYATLLISDVIY